MKRYYIPKAIPAAADSAPLLVVADNWSKTFDSAVKAKRSVPPVGVPTARRSGVCRGWVFTPNERSELRSLATTHLEIDPRFLATAMMRIRNAGFHWRRTNVAAIIPPSMIIPAPDYALLKTNHKIGAPKGRLP